MVERRIFCELTTIVGYKISDTPRPYFITVDNPYTKYPCLWVHEPITWPKWIFKNCACYNYPFV